MPYLSVDEQSTYIDTFCDGYYIRVQTSTTNVATYIGIFADGTENLVLGNRINDGSTQYAGYSVRVTKLIESTTNRVVIYIKGGIASTYAGSNPTGVTSFESYLTIYPDRIFFRNTLSVDSNTYTITDNISINGIIYCGSGGGGLTSAVHYREVSGSETTGGSYFSDDDTMYGGATATELNFQLVVLDYDFPSNFHWYFGSAATDMLGPNNLTLPEGKHSMTTCLILDSVEREGSSKIYSSADRMAFAQQYKSLVL